MFRFFKKEKRLNHLYLLVHPYYGFLEEDQTSRFRRIWMESVAEASKEDGCFAIMYIPGIGHNDSSDSLRFHIVNPSKIEMELAKHVKRSFGKNRCKFVMANNLGFPALSFERSIEERIADRKTAIITARGVYADRCVEDAVYATIKAYDIPKENATIVYPESLFASEKTAEEYGFPKNFRF